jgi:LmbE family N-acetylglucosaminyl deacetylase
MSPPPSRRDFLAVTGAAAAGAVGARPAAAGGRGRSASPDSRQTVLGIGAHYDDCAFGVPGILLKAVENGHRVVVLTLIGDYDNWKPVRGRGAALVDGTRGIAAEYGVESRFLGFASGTMTVTEAAQRSVAEAVAEVKPDVAFMLWPRDRHPDHEVASALSQTALRLGDRLLPDPFAPWRPARRIFLYDNGPRHTIGFEPDTFVDVTPQWPRAIAWLGRLMALTRGEEFDPEALDGAQRLKESLARYRGSTCGVEYAEALVSGNAYPREVTQDLPPGAA